MINCFAYLGFTDIYDVYALDLHDYVLMMRGHRLRELDRQYEMHWQAWLNQSAQATKEKGKKHVPVFDSFKQFFDYEKERDILLGRIDKEPIKKNKLRTADIAMRANMIDSQEDK